MAGRYGCTVRRVSPARAAGEGPGGFRWEASPHRISRKLTIKRKGDANKLFASPSQLGRRDSATGDLCISRPSMGKIPAERTAPAPGKYHGPGPAIDSWSASRRLLPVHPIHLYVNRGKEGDGKCKIQKAKFKRSARPSHVPANPLVVGRRSWVAVRGSSFVIPTPLSTPLCPLSSCY